MCLGESESAADRIQELLLAGHRMSTKDKLLLEEQVANNPDDIDSRTKLLGYYFINGRNDADAKFNTERHVLWLIENVPESELLGLPYAQIDKSDDPEGYERAKQAWQKALAESPEELSILRSAAEFFLLCDREIAEQLLLKGQSIDAKDPEWAESLGRLYMLGLSKLPDKKSQKAAAKKAFVQNDLAYRLSDAEGKESLLTSLAKSALLACLNDEAKKFAMMMLDDDAEGWDYGNRIHHGNLILGRLALLEGKIDEAKSRLLLAGKTPGSPQLGSFGPNMQLAKELLERGESDVVLEYFALCKEFWGCGDVQPWVDDVKSNRIPDFGANLAY